MNLKQLFNLLLVVTLIVLSLVIMKQCSDLSKVEPSKVEIFHRTDTIWPPKDTVYVYKNIVIPKPVHDTSWLPLNITLDSCNKVYKYTDSLKDDNIDLFYTDYVQGILLKKDLKYKLKVPLKIIDSIKVLEIREKKPIFVLSAGILASKNQVSPMGYIGFNKTEFGIGYDFFNKSPMLSYKYNLFTKYKK